MKATSPELRFAETLERLGLCYIFHAWGNHRYETGKGYELRFDR